MQIPNSSGCLYQRKSNEIENVSISITTNQNTTIDSDFGNRCFAIKLIMKTRIRDNFSLNTGNVELSLVLVVFIIDFNTNNIYWIRKSNPLVNLSSITKLYVSIKQRIQALLPQPIRAL